ncbi:MAG: hypothetical protein WD749_04860 [Phycisphaerales bacterium]
MLHRVALLSAAALMSLAPPGFAQGPLATSFTYQGELNQSGSPAAGPADFRFRLYDAPTGGAQLGPTLCADNTGLSGGRFSLELDFGAVFSGQQRFLEIEVRPDTGADCASLAGFIILGPRQRLTAAPSALFALNAAAAATAASATTATNATQLNGQGASFYQDASNLSGGTLGDARLAGAYTGPLTLSNAGNAFSGVGSGLTGLDASNIAGGTLADARLSANVALLNAAQTFSAVNTFAAAPSFTDAGSPFSVMSTTLVTNLNADLLDGLSSTSFAQRSGAGTATFTNIPAFNGGAAGSTPPFTVGSNFLVTNLNADRLDGLDSSQFLHSGSVPFMLSGAHIGAILQLHNTFATGAGVTMYSQNDSTNGRAVHGVATATTGLTFGGTFHSSAPSGRGVLGFATNGTGTNYGVYGRTDSASGYGLFAEGRTGASGTKSFRIDHPDDPENKYLLHYTPESPEVINFYRGTVRLDGAGAAVVELPRYFATINKAPSYVLTAVGAPMPMLHVAEEIDEAALSAGAAAAPGDAAQVCSFRIAGGAPGGKVSWRVDAVRNDRWVRQRGAPVEIDKQGPEKGTYQHPELYGQPPEKGMSVLPGT